MNEHEQTRQQQETTQSITIYKIIHTIATLPNNHEVWEYVNPTKAFFTKDKSNTYLDKETLTHFIDWYDYQVYMLAELKENQYNQGETNVFKLGQILTEESDFLGKSKVQPTPSEESLDSRESSTAAPTPTWGRSKEENHEQRLQQWIDTPIRPTTNTTRLTQQDDYTKIKSDTSENPTFTLNPDKVNREAREDEIEFTRIPIAGEDSEDYDVDYDTEEEEDEVTDEETTILPIVFPIQWSTPPPNHLTTKRKLHRPQRTYCR